MKITFTKSLILSLFIIFFANIYEIMNTIPPDGRWKVQMPITTIFIIIYSILFIIINKKLLKNPKNYYFMLLFSAILSIVFISFAHELQMKFQDVTAFYVMQYIPTLQYIIILGLGLILYIPIIIFLEKKLNKK